MEFEDSRRKRDDARMESDGTKDGRVHELSLFSGFEINNACST